MSLSIPQERSPACQLVSADIDPLLGVPIHPAREVAAIILAMRSDARAPEFAAVLQRIVEVGAEAHFAGDIGRVHIAVVGDKRLLDQIHWEQLPGLARVLRCPTPYVLGSRTFSGEPTVLNLNGVRIGGEELVVMAGPCAIESPEQLAETAAAVKAAGAKILRGGAFKPRTSPYTFQGLGEDSLSMLRDIARHYGLLTVTEVMSPVNVPLVCAYADIVQVGARNMQNYSLLHAVGESHHPVLLKRGMSATIEELLLAAEYILLHGNDRVMVCERGIRTFEPYTRNTLDINAIPALKQLTHLPVIADPSHGTGRRELVEATAGAAIAAGADGLIVEVHPHPEQALSDGAQSLYPDQFAAMVARCRRIAAAVDRKL